MQKILLLTIFIIYNFSKVSAAQNVEAVKAPDARIQSIEEITSQLKKRKKSKSLLMKKKLKLT